MKRTKAKRGVRRSVSKRVSTAVAKRTPAVVERAPAQTEASRALVPMGEESTFGALGLSEVRFTAGEEAVLSEPAPIDAIRVKPTSKGQVYLSHPDYTRWFNRAFGRTGWTLRPVSPPMVQGRTVGMNFVLFVHGLPVASAFGEQEYHETNKEQTYGDAIESTYASALRRCAKRLGVGLELWDRDFCNRFLLERCVRVQVDGKRCWRRRVDSPLPGENAKPSTSSNQPPRDLPPAAEGTIDAEQKLRLWTIARRRGRTVDEVVDYLRGLGYNSTDAIEKKVYATVCATVEGQGPLPVKAGGGE